MAFISFGRIDKKLLFVAAIVIIQIINSFVIYQVQFDTNMYLDDFIENIGSILIGTILYLIYIIYLIRKEKIKIKKIREAFKYIVCLFFLLAIKIIYDRMYIYFNTREELSYDTILNTINGVEIILMTFGTSLLLKYKYYIHHAISMSLFCLLGIAKDFILGNFFELNYSYIVFHIIYILDEVMIYCFFKYMMDKLYYNYYEVIIYW